ncbi:hypothetical protein PAXINDRAFT_101160 [Paxillus involutus ATCC 200175]|uniref:Protein kinase domain-containing protein n=1 Tax=Paxillus involutus ATCC 200175 TaxID=664439 RepID=A0A0C9TY50_PAXIN|nr:hypothetical protein PAXINDRAFT_101160 [Paxillus involutus ATCC 200175]
MKTTHSQGLENFFLPVLSCVSRCTRLQSGMLRLYEAIKRTYRRVRGLPQLPLLLLGHTGAVWSVAFLPDGKQVISGSVDCSVRGWRIKGGGEVGKPIWEKGWVLAVAASGDGHWIATGGRENNITIWDAMTHEKVVQLEGHSDTIRSLAFSQDSGRVVSGSRDRTVIVWRSRTGERLVGPFTGHTHTVWEVGFSPSGKEIASCDGGAIHIWNSHSGELLRPINVAAVSCAWTPDGQQLIAGFEDGSVERFDSSSGSLLADWKAHIDLVSSIAVSRNGTFIASASRDRTVRLWDITTGSPTQIGSPLNCDDKVYSVAISLAGKHLMSGGGDGRVRIWRLKGMVPSSLLKNIPRIKKVMSSASEDSEPSPRGSPASGAVYMDFTDTRPSTPTTPRISPEKPSSEISRESRKIGTDEYSFLSYLQLPMAQALLASEGDVRPGSSTVNTSTALGEPIQHAPWSLDDVRSSFPNDLTGSVKREGEYPFASGSYGDIYRGTLHARGGSIDVAVKAIRTYAAEDGDDSGKKKRLNREIRVWLNLKHINVLPLFGTTMGFGHFPAMVCPWLEGGPLTSYLERRGDTLTTVERLVLLHDVAVGLQYLHSQTVVHGDLSGSNVLIDGNGRACIADFGLSTLLTALGESTFSTSFKAKGTLRWAAPELLHLNDHVPGEEENIPRVPPTPQSDIYSFGAITLQILTGKIPYHYYPRDEPVLLALSQGETPKRPSEMVVTDRRWIFIQQCWTSVDAGQSRPSDDEIVEFTRNELVKLVLPQS